ncbi:MAG TPA: carboxypeptidase-like regulatory domain-containing protein, partial [Blastocatellia bacterium]|nr:carboxypeptidase-like regulatory domain-containing protein [Blastocatellia bacterium]
MSLRSLAKTVAFLTFLIIVTSPLALAQFNSAVEGTVTDQAGAAVPDAQVVLLNVATGVSQTTQSNAEGYYRFPSLPPGTYQVTASAKDFVSVTQENIALGASEVRTIPLALKVGRPTEQVTITAEPPPLQKTEAKIGQDLSSREVAGLPLAGRNIFNLISLSPGVTGIGNLTDTAGGTDVFALVGNPSINANGQRGDGNAFYIDGTSANSNPDPGTFNVTPNPESIAEFTVAVNDYSAEHGRSGSLVIQAVTKSGTNEFHGSAFEYHQDNKLTARNVFQNTPDPLTGRILPVSRRNEFGGAVGGPIQKDKMFFFF